MRMGAVIERTAAEFALSATWPLGVLVVPLLVGLGYLIVWWVNR